MEKNIDIAIDIELQNLEDLIVSDPKEKYTRAIKSLPITNDDVDKLIDEYTQPFVIDEVSNNKLVSYTKSTNPTATTPAVSMYYRNLLSGEAMASLSDITDKLEPMIQNPRYSWYNRGIDRYKSIIKYSLEGAIRNKLYEDLAIVWFVRYRQIADCIVEDYKNVASISDINGMIETFMSTLPSPDLLFHHSLDDLFPTVFIFKSIIPDKMSHKKELPSFYNTNTDPELAARVFSTDIVSWVNNAIIDLARKFPAYTDIRNILYKINPILDLLHEDHIRIARNILSALMATHYPESIG